MWQQILNLLKLAFTFAEKLQKMEGHLKEHSQLIKELSANQTRLHYEYQIQRERDARERERERYEFERNLYEHRHAADSREKELLQLEIQSLQSKLDRVKQPSLPAASIEKKPDES